MRDVCTMLKDKHRMISTLEAPKSGVLTHEASKAFFLELLSSFSFYKLSYLEKVTHTIHLPLLSIIMSIYVIMAVQFMAGFCQTRLYNWFVQTRPALVPCFNQPYFESASQFKISCL